MRFAGAALCLALILPGCQMARRAMRAVAPSFAAPESEPEPRREPTPREFLGGQLRYLNWICALAALAGLALAVAFKSLGIEALGGSIFVAGAAGWAVTAAMMYVLPWFGWGVLAVVIVGGLALIWRFRRFGFSVASTGQESPSS
jgi:hypothetical protein